MSIEVQNHQEMDNGQDHRTDEMESVIQSTAGKTISLDVSNPSLSGVKFALNDLAEDLKAGVLILEKDGEMAAVFPHVNISGLSGNKEQDKHIKRAVNTLVFAVKESILLSTALKRSADGVNFESLGIFGVNDRQSAEQKIKDIEELFPKGTGRLFLASMGVSLPKNDEVSEKKKRIMVSKGNTPIVAVSEIDPTHQYVMEIDAQEKRKKTISKIAKLSVIFGSAGLVLAGCDQVEPAPVEVDTNPEIPDGVSIPTQEAGTEPTEIKPTVMEIAEEEVTESEAPTEEAEPTPEVEVTPTEIAGDFDPEILPGGFSGFGGEGDSFEPVLAESVGGDVDTEWFKDRSLARVISNDALGIFDKDNDRVHLPYLDMSIHHRVDGELVSLEIERVEQGVAYYSNGEHELKMPLVIPQNEDFNYLMVVDNQDGVVYLAQQSKADADDVQLLPWLFSTDEKVKTEQTQDGLRVYLNDVPYDFVDGDGWVSVEYEGAVEYKTDEDGLLLAFGEDGKKLASFDAETKTWVEISEVFANWKEADSSIDEKFLEETGMNILEVIQLQIEKENYSGRYGFSKEFGFSRSFAIYAGYEKFSLEGVAEGAHKGDEVLCMCFGQNSNTGEKVWVPIGATNKGEYINLAIFFDAEIPFRETGAVAGTDNKNFSFDDMAQLEDLMAQLELGELYDLDLQLFSGVENIDEIKDIDRSLYLFYKDNIHLFLKVMGDSGYLERVGEQFYPSEAMKGLDPDKDIWGIFAHAIYKTGCGYK